VQTDENVLHNNTNWERKKIFFFLGTFGLGWDFRYTQVFRMCMSNLFVHECINEGFSKIELILFLLWFVQIHTPCNKEWKETTQGWRETNT
jgi:hypothetical protein